MFCLLICIKFTDFSIFSTFYFPPSTFYFLICAGRDNRNPVYCLEGSHSTTKLCPRLVNPILPKITTFPNYLVVRLLSNIKSFRFCINKRRGRFSRFSNIISDYIKTKRVRRPFWYLSFLRAKKPVIMIII